MSRSRYIPGAALVAMPFVAVVLTTFAAAAWRGKSLIDVAIHIPAMAGLLLIGVLTWRSSRSQKRAADRLRRSEARQRAIIDAAGDAVIVIDDQATILTFNRAAERMFGYTADEMIGTSLERLMTDGGRKAHAAYLAKNGVTAMVEAARLRTVHKGIRKRGDAFPFELTMSEWREDGRRMFTGLIRDVTESERTVNALRESQARFAALFEASLEPLIIFELAGDGTFVIETMNRAAEERTGLSRFAVKGCPPEEVAARDEARSLRRALLRCLETASSVTEEVRLHALGESRGVRLTLSPMRDAAGEIRRVLACGRDPSAGLSGRADRVSKLNAA